MAPGVNSRSAPWSRNNLRYCFKQGVLRVGQDAGQFRLPEVVQRGDDRQPTDELGDHAERLQVLGQHMTQEVAFFNRMLVRCRPEAEPACTPPKTPGDDLLQAGEGPAADEEHAGRVERAPSPRRGAWDRASSG